KSQKGEKEAELASLMEGLTSHQIEKATYEAELKALDAEIAPMKASISRSEEELARLHQRIDELGSSIISLSSLIEDERRLCEGFQQEASLATKELEECRQRRGELESGLASLESDIKQKRRRLAQAQDAENRLSLESARFLGEFEALTARLKKEHGITFDDIPSEEGAAFDKEATSVRIEELKAAIESLGDVNLTAAEELDNLKSRLSFMRGQIEDLDRARASLAQVIKEAERTARKQFIEMFAQIRENFKELFAQLFEGGQADIVLVDEEEPLESGIEIICRPPGKKLSQLSLLSGGEKALAAIALIFSFLKSRPAPFCILDEIDAALDEANLQRFKELVSDYSKRSQMIIITHRRRTMESAGRVYGVTMEEQGVSKSVCVDTSQLTFQEGMV
ncbi:MAG TPA: chromosome segregation protein SMC, partial [Bacillota bacterium]|nr:chromosome segregation protein SMC [Bacillota bacterium]